jgi:hypothetical protein
MTRGGGDRRGLLTFDTSSLVHSIEVMFEFGLLTDGYGVRRVRRTRVREALQESRCLLLLFERQLRSWVIDAQGGGVVETTRVVVEAQQAILMRCDSRDAVIRMLATWV